MELNFQEIGNNIRRCRKRQGLKQHELAALISRSPQHMSHIENGDSVALSTVLDITWALRVDIRDLLGNNLPQNPNTTEREQLMQIAQHASTEDIVRLLQIWNIMREMN